MGQFARRSACPYTMRPILAHKAACIGASQAHVLNQWSNSGKTEVVGIPRLDAIPAQPHPPRNDREFRVLVMTRQNSRVHSDPNRHRRREPSRPEAMDQR